MTFRKFEDIEIWKDGREVVKKVYDLTSRIPFSADKGLKDQIRRAAVSICANIAEGYARRGNREMIKFLWISKGSAAEVQSHLYHALDFSYMDQASFELLYERLEKIQIRIFHLIKTLTIDSSRQKSLEQSSPSSSIEE
jgi:four helix bundle protein